jgi:hypothetical protein
VFHMVDQANWQSVAQRGLLSASMLIDELPDIEQRADLKRRFRPSTLVLQTGCRLRDQRPMPPACLARCLDQPLQPADWYALVNDRVFFWASAERLQRHHAACLDRAQVILAIDTEQLMAQHADEAEVTAFNTGNARRLPAKRGNRSFVPYRSWLENAWQEEQAFGRPPRPPAHRPIELVVRHAVPNVLSMALRTIHLPAGRATPDFGAARLASGSRRAMSNRTPGV